MLNKTFYLIALSMLSIPISSYATYSLPPYKMNIPCKAQDGTYMPTRIKRPNDPKVQLSLTFDGVWVKGYTNGLILGNMEDTDLNIYRTLPIGDREIQKKTRIHINVKCAGKSGKKLDVEIAGNSIVCDKGEGYLIELYDPECNGQEVDKMAIFTMVEYHDDEDKMVQPSVPVYAAEPGVPQYISAIPQSQPPVVASGPVYDRTAPVMQPPVVVAGPVYNRMAPAMQPPFILQEMPGTIAGNVIQPPVTGGMTQYGNTTVAAAPQPPVPQFLNLGDPGALNLGPRPGLQDSSKHKTKCEIQ